MKLFKRILASYQLLMSVLAIVMLVLLVNFFLNPNAKLNWLPVSGLLLILFLQLIFGTWNGWKLFRNWQFRRKLVPVISYGASVFLTIIFVFVALFGNQQVSSNPDNFTLPLNSQAPDFTTVTFSGEEINLSDYKGKYVFLDFWATWCAPCVKDLKYVQQLNEKMEGKNLVILGINQDKEMNRAVTFLDQQGYSFDQVHDDQEDISDLYNIQSIPKNFLIDPEGTIIEQNLHEDKIVSVVSEHLEEQELVIN